MVKNFTEDDYYDDYDGKRERPLVCLLDVHFAFCFVLVTYFLFFFSSFLRLLR